MVMKKIELEGYGSVVLYPIKFRKPKSSWINKDNKEVKYTIEGKGKGIYKDDAGKEYSRAQLRKKYLIGGKEIVTDRLKATTIIRQGAISFIENPIPFLLDGVEYEKFGMVTDNKKIKEVFEEGKTFVMSNVVLSSGGLPWRCYLHKYTTKSGKDKFAMTAVRGSFDEVMEGFEDSPIEIDYSTEQNASELGNALGV